MLLFHPKKLFIIKNYFYVIFKIYKHDQFWCCYKWKQCKAIQNGHIFQTIHTEYRGSWSAKTNALLNLISQQQDINKIYLYAEELNEPKYQLLIKKREHAGIKHWNDPREFIEYWNTMDDVYNNIDDYNLKRNRKILIVLDETVADMNTTKKFLAIFKELFIRCNNLNISFVLSRYLIFLFRKMSD